MAKSDNKTYTIGVRFDQGPGELLDKLGRLQGLDLGAYIRKLVYTHPEVKEKITALLEKKRK